MRVGRVIVFALLLLLTWMGSPHQSRAAITKVQSVTGAGPTLTLNGVAAGNLLVLNTTYYRGAGSHAAEAIPTDTNGTWSVARADVPALFTGGTSDDIGTSIFYVQNAASGTHTVTPEANTKIHCTLTEYSGVVTAGSLDTSASGKTENTTHTSRTTGTTATTSQADELVVIGHGMVAGTGASNVGYTDPVSGFTTLQKVVDDATDVATFHAFKIISSTGTQSATFDWTASESTMSSQAVIATFKASAAAGGVPEMSLLGVGL